MLMFSLDVQSLIEGKANARVGVRLATDQHFQCVRNQILPSIHPIKNIVDNIWHNNLPQI